MAETHIMWSLSGKFAGILETWEACMIWTFPARWTEGFRLKPKYGDGGRESRARFDAVMRCPSNVLNPGINIGEYWMAGIPNDLGGIILING